jgi:5-hydroxyisourate hydrolase-like protein (transthyretin family)
VLTLLMPLFLAIPLFAQAPAKQPAAKTPRGSVSGRVTIKDKPAAGVVVGLRSSDNMSPLEPFSKATTDQNGVYRIASVAAGSYQVMAAAPGYVLSDANNYRPASVVVLGEDENVDNVNFSLVRGGVITGKVVDADGRPVILTSVSVYRLDVMEKQSSPRALYPEATGQTDDRGIYRIFGLAPGKFKVAAGRGEDGTGGFSPFQGSYKQVFHPDATDLAKATIIEVSEGSEANNVDIALGRAVQTFSVSGRVINTDSGLPVSSVRFGLQRLVGERSEYVPSVIATNARGDFVAEGLIPGKYGVIQFSNLTNELRTEATTFDVIDQDVTDVTIRLAKGASVSGFVVLETDDKAVRSKMSEMVLRAFVQTVPGAASSSASSPIAADGSFRLAGLQSGMVTVSLTAVNAPFPPKGISISRIERDGVAIPRIEVKDGETVTGVKVFVSYGNASLRGVVTVENGSLPDGARIFVRLVKTGETASFLRPPAVDARGHFLMEGIPPGVYEVTAQVFGPNIKAPRPVKRTVTLTDGVVADVAITIDLAAQTPANP